MCCDTVHTDRNNGVWSHVSRYVCVANRIGELNYYKRRGLLEVAVKKGKVRLYGRSYLLSHDANIKEDVGAGVSRCVCGANRLDKLN